MRIRYDLKRSKMLENLLFLALIRAVFEIVDIELRRGRFHIGWALGEITLLFIGVLIVLACTGVTVSETAGAVGVAGLVFLYFYQALLTGMGMIVNRSWDAAVSLAVYAVLSLACVAVMMFMFGKLKHRVTMISSYTALALTVAYALYQLVMYFATDMTLSLVAFAEICIPAMLVIIMKSSTER